MYPDDLKYTAEHEWIRVPGDSEGSVRVGITHYAQDALGDDLWGVRFEGHHVSLHATVASDEVRLTPLFLGIKQVKLDAADFSARPALWYETAARHAATDGTPTGRARPALPDAHAVDAAGGERGVGDGGAGRF